MSAHPRRFNNWVLAILAIAVLLTTSVFTALRQVPSETIPPGGQLPSEQECAAKISRTTERIPENEPANSTNAFEDGLLLEGSQLAHYGGSYELRVTGNFTGTTDEIIEWGACKWGFDADTVRAQAVVESSWRQSMLGDCAEDVETQSETDGCESVGLLQVKAADIPPTHPSTWPDAWTSTAFNVDYTLAIRRACFDGREAWLQQKHAPGGESYAAGDEWGCIGRWFSGDWYGYSAKEYIHEVKEALASRTWNSYGAARRGS